MKGISGFIISIFAAAFLLMSCNNDTYTYYDVRVPTKEDKTLETLGAYSKVLSDGTKFAFGTFPQSEKADGVKVYEDDAHKITRGDLDYYLGSDNYYYCRQKIEEWGIQKAEGELLSKWYKVEPIVWQAVNSGKEIFVTENKLLPFQFYGWHGTDGKQTAERANGITDMHYKYSNIRTFLNGSKNQYLLDYKSGSIEQDRDWTGRGFIDIAFTESQKAQIKAHQMTDSYYGGDAMTDKIFVLSKAELGSAKIKTEHSGYAKACVTTNNENDYNHWWLRDFAEKEHNICTVRANGDLSDTFSNNEHAGIVPAICLN